MTIPGAIRAARIKHYITAMRRLGYAPEDVLEGTGLTRDAVFESRIPVDFAHYHRIASNILDLSDDPHIGLTLGESMDFGDLGILGALIVSCDTLRDSTEMWATYSNLMVGSVIEIEHFDVDERSHLSLNLSEMFPLGDMKKFYFDEYLSSMFSIGNELNREPLTLHALQLDYDFGDPAAYEHVLGLAPQRSPKGVFVKYKTPSAYARMPEPDSHFNQLCRGYFSHIEKTYRNEYDIIGRLNNLFYQKFEGLPDFSEAAKEIGMSPRTLRRRLKEAGKSYRELVDNFRMSAAIEQLKDTSLCAKEISHNLGFKDTNSFRRAFKAWTGMTVSQYKG